MCEWLLPHALACAGHIKKWQLVSEEAAYLLNQVGLYLHDRARYAEALPLYQQALKIYEQALGPDHPDVATVRENLAELYRAQGQDAEAIQTNHDLFERVKVAPEIEREQIIEALHQKARQTESADDWNHLALIMQAAGKLEGALIIFEQLVQAYPGIDVYRLNLATTFSQARQFELCSYHLRFLTEHSSDEKMRQYANEQLAGMERFLGQTEQDSRYHQLQLESLRESIDTSQAGEDEYRHLARVLLLMIGDNPDISLLEEAISVLEEGQKRFPDSVDILEYLILCYLRYDPEARLDDTLKQLEKLAPDSSVLQMIRGCTRSLPARDQATRR